MQNTIFVSLTQKNIIVFVKIHSKYADQSEAVKRLVANFLNSGELVVQGSRNAIKTNFLGEEKVSIKFFQKPSFLKAIMYSFFRSTKAKRSYEYANYLIENNINTPFPIAYVEFKNRWGLLQESYYICKHIAYDFTIRELIHDPLFPDRTSILEQFTIFTFQLHEARVHFLDHSPGNTLIVKKGHQNFDFYLIDLNRMTFENLSVEKRMDNFKKMWLSKAMVKIIAKKYAALLPYDESKLLELLMKSSQDFKRKITRKKYLKRKIGKK
ncbi:hypothetical protein CLV55_11434 [Flavobacterium aciduliphilum]|uniref:Lipopolysaccharide kinase (Kdo/WaaP) family protein n=1 Tax=Flavobacterium aciduliphilum TaxID=1101402 RepID=A0A328Y7C3_9FLAO|nr:hypothetical protein CLV55_11434 [Flavobacterium aciduliphilum]